MRASTCSAIVRAMTALLTLLACQDYEVHRFQQEDSFTQGDPGAGVDILWIIDNSGTMTEEQDLLVQHFDSFAEVLTFTGVDYRIGVTTTDWDATAGKLVGDVLGPDTPDLGAAFAEQATQGTTGSRDEQPLEVARAAIGSVNPGFTRADSGLRVIVVTDEDDHSREEVQSYLDDIDLEKGVNPWALSALAGNEPDGCHSSFADATAASRILQAVKATDGTFESICSADFGPILSELALGSADMTARFELSTFPEPGTIEVTVDDAPVIEHPDEGWTYTPGDNAVVFNGDSLPKAGQYVLISYYEWLRRDTGASE
jgi:hypothetical protein